MILVLIGAAFCVAVAGCTTTGQGQPLPQGTGTSETTTSKTSQPSTPGSTAPSNGELPSNGAPKVNNPLDTSRFQQNPCQVLTAAQLQELNLPAQGEQRQQPVGLACHWSNRETGGDAEIGWDDKSLRGLSGTYAARDAGLYAYFIELPAIEGFPAVAASRFDTRDVGDGVVTVGVSDQVVFLASVHLSRANVGKRDPVEVAVQVAGMVLQTMKAGG